MQKKEPKVKPKSWEGGAIHYGKDGQPHYSIDRVINGQRYKISLHTSSIHAARAHWDRFQINPEAFRQRGPLGEATNDPEPVYLTPELASQFLDHSKNVKQNSDRWRKCQKLYLADWTEDLHGLNLRGGVNLVDHIDPMLDKRGTARKLRIEVIKVFYAWLRKTKHLLTYKDDPTIGDLPVPQSAPEKHKHSKIIPQKDVLAARAHMSDLVRDAIDVTLATAWHGTEVRLFAIEGTIIERPKRAHKDAWPKDVAAVLEVKQKTGGIERWSIRKKALEAAKRLKAHGKLNERNVNRVIERACAVAGVPAFTYGPLRHSVLTWAKESGASIADIAADLAHHKDQRTTERFYLDVKVPKLLPTIM